MDSNSPRLIFPENRLDCDQVLREKQSFLNGQVVWEVCDEQQQMYSGSPWCGKECAGLERRCHHAAALYKQDPVPGQHWAFCVCFLHEGQSNLKQVCLVHRPQVKLAPRTVANSMEIKALWRGLTCHFTK